jgi:Zn finger protein HypA/HybF involved in hydrogenase expression
MKFIFVCPAQNKVFESADFIILENRGVITEADGNKTLDAKVALNQPCPFCGRKHVYHARELSCPFGGPEK